MENSAPNTEPQHYPEAIVRALLKRPDDRYLLVRSHKWKDHWVLPGGHIERGESVEAALQREVREETGLSFEDYEFLGYQNALYPPEFYAPKHFVFLDFLCHTSGGHVTLNDEAEDWVWLKPEEAMARATEPLTRHCLTQALKRATSAL